MSGAVCIEGKDQCVSITLINLTHGVVRSGRDLKTECRTAGRNNDIIERFNIGSPEQHEHSTICFIPATVQLDKEAMGFTVGPGVVMNPNFLGSIELMCRNFHLRLQRDAQKRSNVASKFRFSDSSENSGFRTGGRFRSRKSNSYCS